MKRSRVLISSLSAALLVGAGIVPSYSAPAPESSTQVCATSAAVMDGSNNYLQGAAPRSIPSAATPLPSNTACPGGTPLSVSHTRFTQPAPVMNTLRQAYFEFPALPSNQSYSKGNILKVTMTGTPGSAGFVLELRNRLESAPTTSTSAGILQWSAAKTALRSVSPSTLTASPASLGGSGVLTATYSFRLTNQRVADFNNGNLVLHVMNLGLTGSGGSTPSGSDTLSVLTVERYNLPVVSTAVPPQESTTDFYADLTGTETTLRTEANQGPIPLRASFTLDFWVFDPASRDNSRATILAQSTSDTNRLEIQVDRPSDSFDQELILVYRGVEHRTLFKLPQDTWTHITLLSNASFSGQNKIWLRVNNKQVFEVVTDTPVDAGVEIKGPLFIGRAFADNAKQLFKGRVDQVKVWNGELSNEAIERSMHTWGAQNVQPGTSLLAHYDFNDRTIAGGQVYNRAANTHNLTLTASAGTSPFIDVKQTISTSGKTTYYFPRSYLTEVGGWRAPNGVTAIQEALVVGGGGAGAIDGGPGGAGAGAQLGSIPAIAANQVLAIRVGQGGVPGQFAAPTSLSTGGQSSSVSLSGNSIATASGGAAGFGFQSTTRAAGGVNPTFPNFQNITGGSGGLGVLTSAPAEAGLGGTSTTNRFDKTYSFSGGGGGGIAIPENGQAGLTQDITRAPGQNGGGEGASVGSIGTGKYFCAALSNGRGSSTGGNATSNTGGGGGGGTAGGSPVNGGACRGTPDTSYDGERGAGGHGGSGVVIFGVASSAPVAPAPTFTVTATDNGTDALTATWPDMPNAATTRKVVQYRVGNGPWLQVLDSPSATSVSLPRTSQGIIEFRVSQFNAPSEQWGEWVYSNQLNVNLYSGVLCNDPLKLVYDIPASQTITMGFINSLSLPGISIRWGDGTSVSAFTTADTATVTQRAKTFANPGAYTIEVCGKFQSFATDGLNLVEVVQWGEWVDNAGLTNPPARSLASAFLNATRLIDVPQSFPGTVTNASALFDGAAIFNDSDLAGWNMSSVTNMRSMFTDSSAFNVNLSNWNVGQVTDTSSMFSNATSFNQNIASWDVTRVTTMAGMFADATAFNQNISAWNTVNVTDFSRMFLRATAYSHKPPLKIDKATNAVNMLDLSGISDETYSRTILDWAALAAPSARPAALALGAVDKTALCTISGTNLSPQAKLRELVAGGWTVTDKTNRVADACATTITITATNTTQRYGDPVPSVRFTPVVTGPLAADPTWVNQVTCSAKVTANSSDVTRLTPPANNYVTQCTGPTSSGTGINVVYVNGTHTVTTRPIEITIKNRTERKGSTWTTATTSLSNTLDRTEYAITSGELVAADELSVTITKGSALGSSTTQFALTGTLANAGQASRYDVTFVHGTLTVSDKSYVVTAKNQMKIYGDLFNLDNDNGWTCQSESGNSTSDDTCRTSLIPVTLTSAGTPATANAGTYAIQSSTNATVSNDRLIVNTNGGLLTVGKRPLYVTPNDLVVNAGSAVPTYSYAISNWPVFLNILQGNEPDGFVAPTCTSGYSPSTSRGTTLDITCSGGNPGSNYYFVFESATLTVPALSAVDFLTPPEVSANPTTGAALVPFEFTISPFVRVCYATLVVTNLSGNFEVVQGQTPSNIIERRVLVNSSNLRFDLDLPEGKYEYKLLMDGNCAADPDTRSLSITPASNSSGFFSGASLLNAMPVPQSISPSVARPNIRTQATITGENLAGVVRIRIGGKTVNAVTASATTLNFKIPRLKPGLYDILLVMRDGSTQRWENRLRIRGKADSANISKVFPGFAAGSSRITPAMNREITRFLNANKARFSTIECVGYTDGPFVRRTDVPLSMDRARVTCELARSFGYEVVSRSYVNERVPGAQLRRVKLILGQ